MKKTILFIFILALAACDQRETKSTTAIIDSLQAIVKSQTMMLYKYHNITFNEAKYLLHDFVNDTNLSKVATDISISGYLSKEQVIAMLDPVSGTMPGTLFYWCYQDKPGHSDKDSMFLAFKPIGDFDENATTTNYLNDDDQLLKTVEPRAYNQQTSMDSVESYMRNTGEIVRTQSEIITGSEVRILAEAFKTKLQDERLRQCNNKIVGFMRKDELLNMAKVDSCKGLRVFWGFDNSEPVNHIRFIIIPLNEKGQLMVGLNDEIVCVERQIP